MVVFDKVDIKNSLSNDNIFELLQEWGGDPEFTEFGIVSATICHNPPGDGSRKLYYYNNSTLFRCYTGCDEPVFDIFELVIKIADIQHHRKYDLNDAVRWIANRFGLVGKVEEMPEEEALEDWQYLANYNRIQDISLKTFDVILKEYDTDILDRLNYNIRLTPWLKEGISQEVLDYMDIGYYPGGDQITIPHFDKDGRFIGLRGRTMCAEEGELYGKYRPLKINRQMYNHPLGMNLYGFNVSKNQISILKKAIIFESEKSVMLYQSYFGIENNIAVACCGSNITAYQMDLLLNAGAQEIIIAFDRQFQELGDKEFIQLKKKLMTLYNKYHNYTNISFIFDKNMITGYKDSPVDCGPQIFLQLFKERIIL